MIILKERKKSQLLEGMAILNSRSDLPHDIFKYYLAVKAGLEGEMRYDRLIKETVESEAIVLNDLLLTVNGSTIQIDSLVLTPEMIYLFEIKNYKGSYLFEANHYKKVEGFDIPNPKDQLNKALTLMNQLFRQWKVVTPLTGAVVFVNQSFTLYGALPDEQIILPPQVRSYFSGLNTHKNKIPQHIRMLANRLIEHHIHNTPYMKQLPNFKWEELKKGLTCGACRSFDLKMTQRSCLCNDCLLGTSRQETFLCNIEDLILLYPNEKLTTALVYDWLGGDLSKDTIKNSLLKHYRRKGNTKSAFYQ